MKWLALASLVFLGPQQVTGTCIYAVGIDWESRAVVVTWGHPPCFIPPAVLPNDVEAAMAAMLPDSAHVYRVNQMN